MCGMYKNSITLTAAAFRNWKKRQEQRHTIAFKDHLNHTCDMSKIDNTRDLLQSNLLNLDVEFGNSEGFFSAAKKRNPPTLTANLLDTGEYVAEIEGANLKVLDSISLCDNEISRITSFSAEKSSKLYDFVSRFVVLSDAREAIISGKKIKHYSKNIYHQYPTDSVTVPVGTSNFLKFTDNESKCHPLFERVFYVRDEGVDHSGMKRWIVHHRIIVKQNIANLVLRCCHPKFEGPVPFQHMIPRMLKSKLYRIRESRKPNFPFMTIGESTLNAGEKVAIGTRIEVINE